jgi:MarR family transcriptional regulator, organic hydroperoxide resistance regulator
MMNLFGNEPISPPASEELPDATLDAVERLLMRSARRMLFEVAADSPLWDLPVPQIRALHLIAHRKHCAMGDLAARLGVAMSTATQVADRLEQRGWVQRVDDPEDRRVVRLALTPQGRTVVEERRQHRRAKLREALAKMAEEKREALIDGLRALCEAVHAGREGECGHSSSLLRWVREDLGGDTVWEEERPARSGAK